MACHRAIASGEGGIDTKLKTVLMIILLVLTIVPITIVSILLYKSGFSLSKESYSRNLVESINVQSDYISQTIESNMISDFRFAQKNLAAPAKADALYAELTAYLSAAEDKITVCILFDGQGIPVYAIGEKGMVDAVRAQLPPLSDFSGQNIVEFRWGDGSYSLGIVTPVWNQDTYAGCLVSVYDKSYLFKIISSYYEIADTSTYICRENGDVISSRSTMNEDRDAVERGLRDLDFSDEGMIDVRVGSSPLSGYYKNIRNTPWYLSGFVDNALIYSFTNQFLVVYIFIFLIVLLVDILLGLYCSHRVVKPINSLIRVIEGYQSSLTSDELPCGEERGYVETNYLRAKFSELMRKILLTQHNFQGIYQLYESNDMGDVNIDIDVKKQSITSNKNIFQALMNEVTVPEGACVVETFTHCFCEKDQHLLMTLFERMRDEHLSSMQEAEVYTPCLDERWYHTLIVPMYENDRLSRLFIQLRDISGLKKQELQSSEQAKRDALTGLYNRAGFAASVNQALLSSEKADLHGLLFIDLDYFKLVNDNFGHSAGDTLLRTIATALLGVTRPDDIVSRFGGDEFVVFLPRTTPAAVAKVEQRLRDTLHYKFDAEKTSFVVSASIGVSVWHQDAPGTLEQMLQQADAAMYQSKRIFKERARQ